MTTAEVCVHLERHGIPVADFSFPEPPLAEASVAIVQPFQYVSPEGEPGEGVFKLVRPAAETALTEELTLWGGLGDVLRESCVRHGLPPLEFAGPLEDAALLVADEVKLDREQAHLRQSQLTYAEDDDVRIPDLLPWCTPRVTAMTRVRGAPVTQACGHDPQRRRALAERLVDSLIARPFWTAETALFHGDPHGGNLFLDQNDRLVPLDWSLAVTLSKDDRIAVMHLLMGGMQLDAELVRQSLAAMGTNHPGQALHDVAVNAVTKERQGMFPGFDWCLNVFDQAVEKGGLALRAELALFRKALFSLLTLIEDLSPEAARDPVVVGAGLTCLLQELPARLMADPFSRDWHTHVSNLDLFSLWTAWPLTAARFWFGWWADLTDGR